MAGNREPVSVADGSRLHEGGMVQQPSGRQPGQVPTELSTFVGRRRELAEVKRLMAESRLVSLTGTGGVGKTRLAQQYATLVRRAFEAVWFVDLTAIRDPALLTQDVHDPELLAHLVAMELGLRDESTRSSLEDLVTHVGARAALLVLDNCEHLMPACAVLTEALLRSCPKLRVLATSRETLGVSGETVFAVAPMRVPEDRPSGPPLPLELIESVALFVARAQNALPGFRIDGNQAPVAAICRQLDGLPLALELAACWVPVLSPQGVLDRLGDRFGLLTRGPRSASGRQQTLRACVDWSYDLCSKPEQLLWTRVAVFVGGCELDAIEGVCTDDDLPQTELLDVLAGLVDKSILTREDDGEFTRYRMLETLRAYGHAKLVEADENDTLRRRHRDWYLQLVQRAHQEWLSERQPYWLGRLGRARSNLRTAVDYSLSTPGESETALRLVVALPWLYWWGRGQFGEGRRWLEAGLAEAPDQTSLRAQALMLASYLAFSQRDLEPAARLLEDGQRLAERLDDHDTVVYAAAIRGIGAIFVGDLARAQQLLEEGVAMVSEDEASVPDEELRPRLLCALALTAAMAGDYDTAMARADDALEITEPRGEVFWRSTAMWAQALAAWRRGDLDDAAVRGSNSLRLVQRLGPDTQYSTAQDLETLAWISADQDRPRRAATLLGAAGGVLAELGTSAVSPWYALGHREDCERRGRAALGDAAFEEAYARGRTLSKAEWLAYALEESPPSQAPDRERTDRGAAPLTHREREVVDLLAQGLSNKEIAARLVISQRTAETHVQHILTKLDVASRAQVAAWAVAKRQRPDPPSFP